MTTIKTTAVNNMSTTQNTEAHSLPPATSVIASEASASPSVINGREARNLAEKHRRDKLNASIGELAKMVPHVADSPRRLDKTTVLRYATHGLRLQYVFGKSAARRRSLNKSESHVMTNALLHLLDSFFITLTCHGQIVLISSSVEHLLGHCQSDLYGQNILQLTHPEDHKILRQELIPTDIESLFFNDHSSPKSPSLSQQNASASNFLQEQHHCSYSTSNTHPPDHKDQNYNHIENNENYLAEVDEKLQADKRCFAVRLARASPRSESKKVYEIVKIDGCFRRSDFSALATGSCSYPIVSQLTRRSRNNSSTVMCGDSDSNGQGADAVFMPHLMQHDAIAEAALHGVSGNDIVLVAMAHIIRPPKVLKYSLEANRLEYKTRHLIDGRIIDCDNRIGLVAGYLKEEVRNLCPFSFMHQDDVRWVIVALRQMYDCNSNYGESCYRLLSRNGIFIYLSTKGYLEIDKGTNKVHSFVCVNTLLDEEEGKRKVLEMKNKFSIIINAKVPTNSMQDVPASQNPQQLERIVLYLIENLQKRQTNSCVVNEIHSEDNAKRHTSTPPLSLVPPEPASIKNSISKSISVVISTAAKSFVLQNNVNTNGINTNNGSTDIFTKASEQKVNTPMLKVASQNDTLPNRPTVLQMRTQSAPSQEGNLDSLSLNSANSRNSNSHKVSVLKRTRVDTPLPDILKDERSAPQPAKRNLIYSSTSSPSVPTCFTIKPCLLSPIGRNDNDAAKFHDFISSSLLHVEESLDCIDVKTSNIRQNCTSLPTCLDNKLDAIIIEKKKQNKFLVNIKNEYEVYRGQHSKSLKYTKKRQNDKYIHHQKLSSPDQL